MVVPGRGPGRSAGRESLDIGSTIDVDRRRGDRYQHQIMGGLQQCLRAAITFELPQAIEPAGRENCGHPGAITMGGGNNFFAIESG